MVDSSVNTLKILHEYKHQIQKKLLEQMNLIHTGFFRPLKNIQYKTCGT